MSKAGQVVNYSILKQTIQSIPVRRDRAIAAFDYAFGSRIGELAREYHHKYKNEEQEVIPGPKMSDVWVMADGEGDRFVYFIKPNFKQRNKKLRKMTTYMVYDLEPWLTDIIEDWVTNDDYGRKRGTKDIPLFNLKESRLRSVLRKYLKELNIGSHSLRHTRASWYGARTHDAYLIKELLGHSKLQTSSSYVQYGPNIAKRILKGEKIHVDQ